jgi:hypothetical protein
MTIPYVKYSINTMNAKAFGKAHTFVANVSELIYVVLVSIMSEIIQNMFCKTDGNGSFIYKIESILRYVIFAPISI